MNTNQEQFLIAIARIAQFSPAPLVLSRALKLLRDPLADIPSLASLVSSDPSLAADIIRSANSAYYNTGEPVQTIVAAVQKIGFRETTHLLNLAVVRIMAGRDLGSYGITAEDFWAESLFNGLFLRNLATKTGRVDSDEAYTVGLLRFIGRLAINQAIHDLGGGLFWHGNETISQWERENIGFVQAQAGAILLSKWNFSGEMTQAVAGQDAPAELRAPNWLAEALHFATDILPRGLGAPFRHAPEESMPLSLAGNVFMAQHGLGSEDLRTLIGRTCEDYDQIRQNLDT